MNRDEIKDEQKMENSKEFKKGRSSRKSRSRRAKAHDMKSTTNDLSWYSTDPSIVRDAGSFPFSRAAGSLVGYRYQHNLTHNAGVDNFYDFADSSAPGIYRLTVAPTIGYSTDKTSPINIAATALYSYIRHANSGHANYDAPDLMLYMLAVSQIYSIINWCERIYGTMLMYSQRNRFIPRYLLLSDGIDVDDFAANLANYRYGLNLAINKVSALAVPNTMSLFNRHAFLFQNYYIEGPSVKDQIYYLSPQGFSKYQVSEISHAGELRFRALNRTQDNLMGVTAILNYLNDFIDSLLLQEDIGIMSGDILKAYGDNIIKLRSLDEIYAMDLVQDEVFLNQIKNATPIANTIFGITGMGDIGQDTSGNIVAKPYISYSSSSAAATNAIMDVLGTYSPITFNKSDVEPGDVIEATRLHCSVRQITDGGVTREYIFTGTEIPVTATVYRINRQSTLNAKLQGEIVPYIYWFDPTSEEARRVISAVASAGYFKFCNAIFPLWDCHSDNSWEGVIPHFDMDNYSMLSGEEYERLHEACIINMVHVPAIAKAYQG